MSDSTNLSRVILVTNSREILRTIPWCFEEQSQMIRRSFPSDSEDHSRVILGSFPSDSRTIPEGFGDYSLE